VQAARSSPERIRKQPNSITTKITVKSDPLRTVLSNNTTT
jgi:hypothetical protein